MDKLVKSANVWKGLKDYCFLITYSSKGKLREIPIVFDLEDFFHLAGFQYANDIVLFKSSKTKTIDCILNNKITLEQLKKSQNYQTMIDTRLNSLCLIDKVLNNPFKLYRFNTRGYNFYTDIEASYFIYDEETGCSIFFFIREDNGSSYFHGISIFEKGIKDFCMNNRPLKIMKKEKVNLITEDRSVLYENSNISLLK